MSNLHIEITADTGLEESVNLVFLNNPLVTYWRVIERGKTTTLVLSKDTSAEAGWTSYDETRWSHEADIIIFVRRWLNEFDYASLPAPIRPSSMGFRMYTTQESSLGGFVAFEPVWCENTG